MHGDLRPGLERDAGAVREGLVDFDGDDVATRADKLGENGRVIACATTEMKDVVAGMDVKQIQVNCPEARLAIVQALGRIEDDKGILVNVARVGAFSEGLCAADLDQPWAGTDEVLAGNGEKAVRIASEEMPLALHSSSAKERRMDSIETFSKGCIALTGTHSAKIRGKEAALRTDYRRRVMSAGQRG